jgi:hypothetical protein
VLGFIEKFRREGEGVWLCMEPAEVNLPGGRIQVPAGARLVRGTPFMGVDLARLLDEQAGDPPVS